MANQLIARLWRSRVHCTRAGGGDRHANSDESEIRSTLRHEVTPADGRAQILTIPHANCRHAVQRGRWRVLPGGVVAQPSLLWLFCWAKTGQGSPAARDVARAVFNAIIQPDPPPPVGLTPYEWADGRIDHGDAKRHRYDPIPD